MADCKYKLSSIIAMVHGVLIFGWQSGDFVLSDLICSGDFVLGDFAPVTLTANQKYSLARKGFLEYLRVVTKENDSNFVFENKVQIVSKSIINQSVFIY